MDTVIRLTSFSVPYALLHYLGFLTLLVIYLEPLATSEAVSTGRFPPTVVTKSEVYIL